MNFELKLSKGICCFVKKEISASSYEHAVYIGRMEKKRLYNNQRRTNGYGVTKIVVSIKKL